MDIDECLQKVKEAKLLTEREVRIVCCKVKEILAEESNVEPVSTPVTVAGDLHGQFYDVLELFKKGGQLPNTRYIFIGDFVDRGAHSVETLSLLLLLKIKYPTDVFLLRGNHETRVITQSYGFFDEIKKKYGNSNPWTFFVDVFDYLPIGAVVDGKVLCIHGGCSPDIQTIDQIRAIDRKVEPPTEGAYADMLWSDPNENNEGWVTNARGAGWLFGARVVKEFNHLNDLTLIARAHQLVNEGYKFSFQPDNSLVTVWSAPNYTYSCGNLASIMKLKDDLNPRFVVFKQSPHSQNIRDIKGFIPYFL
jgi:serine/threonine-protein phosphatase 6 catalytic subunit